MAASIIPGAARFETAAGVSVAVRVRPRLPHEARGLKGQVVCLPVNSQAVQLGTDSLWGYDVALGEDDGNGSVWRKCQIDSLIQGAFNGYNASVIAYGQTGSGKTFTMGMTAQEKSSNEAVDIGSNPASNPLSGIAAGVCTAIAATLKDVHNAVENGVAGPHGLTSLDVSVSCLQVYCEQLQDLLHPDTPTGSIAVRTARNGATIVTGAQPEPVHSLADVYRWLSVGIAARASGSTAMSQASSRSHLVFSIGLRGTQLLQDGSSRRISSVIRLVDLAGSERQKKTQTSGTRFAESVHINGGLLALGNVINALATASSMPDAKAAHTHIPYRDSKLTRLLVDCLGGNGRTLFIACVSPTASNQHETLSTLRYAQRVLAIKNHPAAQVELVPLPEHTPSSATRNGEAAEAGTAQDTAGQRAQPHKSSKRRSSSARHRQRTVGSSNLPGALVLQSSAADAAVARTVAWMLSLGGVTVGSVLATLRQEAHRVEAMLPGVAPVSQPPLAQPSTAPPHLLSAPSTPASSALDVSVLSPVVLPPSLPAGEAQGTAGAATTAAQQSVSPPPNTPSLDANTAGADTELHALRRTLALQASQLDAHQRAAAQAQQVASAQLAEARAEVALLRTALAAAEASHLSGLAVSRHDVSPAKTATPQCRLGAQAPASRSSAHSNAGHLQEPGSPMQHHNIGMPASESVFDSDLEQSIREAVSQQPESPAVPSMTSEQRGALQSTVRRLRAQVSRAVVSASKAQSLEDSNRSWASVTALEEELTRARQQLLEGGTAVTANTLSPASQAGVAAAGDDSFASGGALDVSCIPAATPEQPEAGTVDDTRNSVSHGVAAAVAAAADAVARELETPMPGKGGRGASTDAPPPATIGHLRGAVAAAARSLGLHVDSPAIVALQRLCSAAADTAVVNPPRSGGNSDPPRGSDSFLSGHYSSGHAEGIDRLTHSSFALSPQQWLAKERRWRTKQEQLQGQLDAAQLALAEATTPGAGTGTALPYAVRASATPEGVPGGVNSAGGPSGGGLPASGGGPQTHSPSSHHAPSNTSGQATTEGGRASSAVTRLDFASAFDSQSGDSDSDGCALVVEEDEGGQLQNYPPLVSRRHSEACVSAPSATWGRGRMVPSHTAAGLQLLSSLDEAELNLALHGSASPDASGEQTHTSGMVWSLS